MFRIAKFELSGLHRSAKKRKSERPSPRFRVSIAENSRRWYARIRAAAADVTGGRSRAAFRDVSHRGRRDDAPWTSPSPPPSSTSSLPPGTYTNRRFRKQGSARDFREHVLLDTVLVHDGPISTATRRRRPGARTRGALAIAVRTAAPFASGNRSA